MTDLAELAARIVDGSIEVIDLTVAAARGHADPPAAAPVGPDATRSSSRRSAATTTAAPPGTGTTSAPASTPAPTWTRRTTGSPARTRRRRPRSRRGRLIGPAVVIDKSAEATRNPDYPARRPATSRTGRQSTARCPTAAGCSSAPAGRRAATTRRRSPTPTKGPAHAGHHARPPPATWPRPTCSASAWRRSAPTRARLTASTPRSPATGGARRGQVRPHPAPQPRPAPGDGRDRHRRAAADRQRLRLRRPACSRSGSTMMDGTVATWSAPPSPGTPVSAPCSASSAAATSTSPTR